MSARAATSSAIIRRRCAEWNDDYRDDVRRFWRGDEDMRAALAAASAGFGDMFDHVRQRGPWASRQLRRRA